MYDEDVAKEALRALGIRNPSASLIQHWIQANLAEPELPPTRPVPVPLTVRPVPPPTAAPVEFRHKHPRGYSKSNLEPALREQGTLERPRGIRKPGRPRIIATWFPLIAKTMADGTPLKDALEKHGITLAKAQIRALYRNEEFKKLFREAREQHRKGGNQSSDSSASLAPS